MDGSALIYGIRRIMLFFFLILDGTPKTVVLNSQINGSWGREEKLKTGYDYSPGKNFTVVLLATETAVSVSQDGNHFYDYKHRLPIDTVVKVTFEWSRGTGTPAKLQQLGVNF